MESEGWVKKIKDVKNIRRISITAKGRRIYQQLIKRECIGQAMSVLTEEELNNLVDLLTKLIDNTLKNLESNVTRFYQAPLLLKIILKYTNLVLTVY